MKGYPKYIAGKQDFINLSSLPEFKSQALIDLRAIRDADDSMAVMATTLIDPDDPEGGWNTKQIANPMPMWKAKGFSSRIKVADSISVAEKAEEGGKKQCLTEK